MNSSEMGFCGSSRTGKSIRFEFAISRFESSRPSQPVTPPLAVQSAALYEPHPPIAGISFKHAKTKRTIATTT
jgi:hypothetical protein